MILDTELFLTGPCLRCKLSDSNIELVEDNLKTRWSGLEGLVEKKLVKNIGVSNFSAAQLDEVSSFSEIKPCLNQVECHPYFPNQALLDYCTAKGIEVMAYGPLGTPTFLVNKDDPRVGHMTIMQEPVIVRVAGNVPRPNMVTPFTSSPKYRCYISTPE